MNLKSSLIKIVQFNWIESAKSHEEEKPTKIKTFMKRSRFYPKFLYEFNPKTAPFKNIFNTYKLFRFWAATNLSCQYFFVLGRIRNKIQTNLEKSHYQIQKVAFWEQWIENYRHKITRGNQAEVLLAQDYSLVPLKTFE